MKAFLFALLTLTVISCSNNKKAESFSKIPEATTQGLPDSIFAFKNLKDTELTYYRSPKYEDFENARLTRINLATLAAWNNKLRFLDTLVHSLEMNEFYYLAKQKPVGDIQPIIICGFGDTYENIILITFDKNNNPIDHYSLKSNMCAGTEALGDSLEQMCPESESYLADRKITTYINDIYLRVNKADSSVTDNAKIDSVVYETVIQPNGKLTTTLVDTFRINRIYKMD